MRPSDVGQMQTTSTPFVWGKGGKRMTPEQIERERQIAASLMVVDFSPVQHWTQGLARVAGNAVGSLREGRAENAAAQNTAESNNVLTALLNPQPAGNELMSPGSEVPVPGGTPSVDPVVQALTSPYIDDATKRMAMQQYTSRNKKAEPIEVAGKLVDPTTYKVLGDFSTPAQSEFERALAASGVQPGSPEWAAAMKTKVQNTLDPWTNIVSGGNSFTGRQSLVDRALNGGAPAAAPPPVLPPDFDFGEGGSTPTASGTFPRQ
jgi:hypothetical protein